MLTATVIVGLYFIWLQVFSTYQILYNYFAYAGACWLTSGSLYSFKHYFYFVPVVEVYSCLLHNY